MAGFPHGVFGGIPHGTTFNVLLPGGNTSPNLVTTYPQNWTRQDPNFDVYTLTTTTFADDFELSY